MKKGLVNINWDDIDNMSQEDISYFLFLEGKSLDSICKIRGLDKQTINKHMIEGKIKYRHLVNSENINELFKSISNLVKQDKILTLRALNERTKSLLINFIKNNYGKMLTKEKENAIWIIGELKEMSCKDILIKGTVHKHVNVRRMAVSAMNKIQNEFFESILIRTLKDPNPQVVLYCIRALQNIKSKKAINNIEMIYKTSNKKYLKEEAKIYLENIKML